MFDFIKHNADSPRHAYHEGMSRYSQVSAGISRAFGVWELLSSKQMSGATLAKSGVSSVINFGNCPEFLKQFIVNNFSLGMGSSMRSTNSLSQLSADIYNNYRGIYTIFGQRRMNRDAQEQNRAVENLLKCPSKDARFGVVAKCGHNGNEIINELVSA